MWYRNKFFQYGTGIILVLLAVFLTGKVDYLFRFILKILTAVAKPVMLAGVFYYLFRPVVGWLEQIRISKIVAILLSFLLFGGVVALFLVYAGSLAGRQSVQLAKDLPWMVENLRDQGEALMRQKQFGAVFSGKVQQQAGAILQQTVPVITRNLQTVLAAFSGVTALLVTVPFILFYFLRDDQEFLAVLGERIPRRYRREVEQTLEATDRILATYLTGQMILAVGQSMLMYFGFWLIGLKYQLILALFVFITAFIPMFGTLLGIIPALLLGLPGGWWMVAKVLGLMVAVNILRKLISPQLVGKRLKIHPLTIILLFIVAGSLFGFFGVLLAVPAYAILKEVIYGTVQLIRLRRVDCEP